MYNVSGTRGYEIGFNVNKYPTSMAEFRKAMGYAIDKEKICKIVFGGYAEPSDTTFLMPGVAHDFVKEDTLKYEYNPEQCKKLLKAAGFVDNNGDGLLEGADKKNIQITTATCSFL